MSSTAVKKRCEMDPNYTWDTSAIFSTEEDWAKALESAYSYVDKIKSYEGRLCSSPETMYENFQLMEEVNGELRKISGYASLKSDEDTAVGHYQDMKGKAQNLSVAIRTANSYMRPEVLGLDDETLEGYYKQYPPLEKYRKMLNNLRRTKDHVLSQAEESILAGASVMSGSPSQIYALFAGADLKFPNAVDAKGNEYALTSGQLLSLLQDQDRELRKSAFENTYKTLMGMKNTTAALLNAQAKQLKFNADVRHYNSSLEAALDGNNVPVAVYENLLESVNRNLPKLHRYMALRKKLMNVDELHMYDIYVPMVGEADEEISYEEAKKGVLEACAVLGDDYVSILETAFNNRWIDVYENEGKRSGAYSSGMADPHPFVLLNHKDNLSSQFTLAHEMGHALHSYHSTRAQEPTYAGYVIFVAEVASTVNEALLMQSLLKKTTDKTKRAYLINYFLEQFRTTLYRQAMFAEFEKLMGDLYKSGTALTAEVLNREYLAMNKRYYGPAVDVDDLIAVEWSRVPHFYYNYYMFQYATGFSAAMAISKRILEEGEPAVKDYLAFLSGGSSMTPIELLKLAGADMTTSAPIDSALELFDSLIDQMEELMA